VPEPIGGYFGLELSARGEEFHRDALRVQSGRAALQMTLRVLGVRRLWIPWFVCRAVPEAAAAAGAYVEHYTLGALDAAPDVEPGVGEAVLVVDYFGLCARATNAVASRLPFDRVIVDASQAFFARPAGVRVSTFYSPRKVVGVPDGGYLLPRPAVHSVIVRDVGTPARMAHLFRRLAGDVRGGYLEFLAAEASLDHTGILGMSALTLDLLQRIDYETVGRRRKENFAALHARFRDRNELFALGDAVADAVPLCYPLLLDRPVDVIRARLSAVEVFVPHYWPELRDALPAEAKAERRWFTHLLALPCDQRYAPDEIERMADAVDAALTRA
jgi:hypothetical protein